MSRPDSLHAVRSLSWLIMSAATAGIALATLALLVAGSAVASTIVLGVAALAAGLLSVMQIRTSLHGAPPTEPVPAEPATDAEPGLPISDVTGLYRPWIFRQRLGEEVARDQRYGHSFAVLLLEPADLLVLPSPADYAEAARELQHWLREGDFAAQYDEERVVVLMPETDGDTARAAGKSILLGLRDVTVSRAAWRGSIVRYPEDGKSADDLLDRAAELLKQGRVERAERDAA